MTKAFDVILAMGLDPEEWAAYKAALDKDLTKITALLRSERPLTNFIRVKIAELVETGKIDPPAWQRKRGRGRPRRTIMSRTSADWERERVKLACYEAEIYKNSWREQLGAKRLFPDDWPLIEDRGRKITDVAIAKAAQLYGVDENEVAELIRRPRGRRR